MILAVEINATNQSTEGMNGFSDSKQKTCKKTLW
jgi:hypothetical protein